MQHLQHVQHHGGHINVQKRSRVLGVQTQGIHQHEHHQQYQAQHHHQQPNVNLDDPQHNLRMAVATIHATRDLLAKISSVYGPLPPVFSNYSQPQSLQQPQSQQAQPSSLLQWQQQPTPPKLQILRREPPSPQNQNTSQAQMPQMPQMPQTPQTPQTPTSSSQKKIFEEHLAPKVYQPLLEQGKLFSGVLRSPRSVKDGFVTIRGFQLDVYIPTKIDRNRCFDGDEVVVQLFPPSQWRVKSQKLQPAVDEVPIVGAPSTPADTPTATPTPTLQTAQNNPDDSFALPPPATPPSKQNNTDNDNDGKVEGEKNGAVRNSSCGDPVVDEILSWSGEPTEEQIRVLASHPLLQATGRVVAIRRSWFTGVVVGTLKPLKNPLPNKAYLVSPLPNIPWVFVEVPRRCAFDNKLYKARTRVWQSHQINLQGKIEGESLGDACDLNCAVNALVIQLGIDDSEFSEECLACLPDLPFQIPEGELAKRRDFTNERVFSIDPATARDLDDALHIKPLENGEFEVGIHIADVSYFLKPETALDERAQGTTRSQYLPQRVIPMLPRVLCDDLCSLHPQVTRLTFSAIARLDSSANILEMSFARSVIRSVCKLSYEEAQSVIDSDSGVSNTTPIPESVTPELRADILALFGLSQHLRKRRFEGGALKLNDRDLKFTLDGNGNPTGISVEAHGGDGSHSLIEEFMLLANIEVARKIAKEFPECAVLRRHPHPDNGRIENIRSVFQSFGVPASVIDNKTVAQIVQQDLKHLDEGALSAVLVALVRQTQAAQYFLSGDLEQWKWQHFALNCEVYTHFTSPIRRYPDVLVHRLLDAAINKQPADVMDPRALTAVLGLCNHFAQVCRTLKDSLGRIFLAHYINTLPTKTLRGLEAIVFDIWGEGFALHLPEIVHDERVHAVGQFEPSGFLFDEKNRTLELTNPRNWCGKEEMEGTVKLFVTKRLVVDVGVKETEAGLVVVVTIVKE